MVEEAGRDPDEDAIGQEQNKHIVKGNWAASGNLSTSREELQRKHDEEVAIIWQEFFSDSGETYYWLNTQESTWDYPPRLQGYKW